MPRLKKRKDVWTIRDDEVIRKYYPNIGKIKRKLSQYRTDEAIKTRASLIGVTTYTTNPLKRIKQLQKENGFL